MKRKYIIKRKSEIDALFKNNYKKGNSYFTVFKKEQEQNANFRFAMSIGRKFGNAVQRNTIKRQIRSIIRENQNLINNKQEFVIVIKPQSSVLTFDDINKNLTKLLINIKIMEN